MKYLLAIFFIILPLSVIKADYFRGNGLIELIDSQRIEDIGMFRGYVAGVQDAHNRVHFCVHKDVRLSQASTIVSNYIKADPKRWHKAAKILVISALREAFPCKEEREKS